MSTFRSLVLALSFAGMVGAALLARQTAHATSPSFDHSHALWAHVLAKHVVGDRFDYAGLKRDRTTLDEYLEQLHALKPEELAAWTREQQFAFWINVYNAHVVALVLTEYPVDNIKDIGGLFSPVWKKAFIAMPGLHPSGKPDYLSLDEIEHQILRPRFRDARVHAAINCASISCPPLRNEAFVAERLDDQLDDQARKWLADPTRNRFDEAKSRAEVSEIFDWFKDDFVRDGGSVLGWIGKYAPASEATWLSKVKVKLSSLDYSWKLNDVRH